jgi:hypothetical protein
MVDSVILSSPLWMLIVLSACVVSRKHFSLRFVFGVIVAEALAIGIATFWLWWLFHDFGANWDAF